MNNKNLSTYGIISFTILFLGGAILFQIFKIEDLPSQFYGALIGVVITAIITVFLLKGQTDTEESKERNIKVFEKKSELFSNFIDELWKVWEDRSVSLEELSALMKMVSKDIIPYANPVNTEKILKSLNTIAEKVTPNQSDSTDNTVTQHIQTEIFSIINVLSSEIGLGGKITDAMQNSLNSLEQKILPYLNKKSYLEKINKTLTEKTKNGLHSFEEEPEVLWWRVGENSEVWLRVGIWGKNLYIAFWSYRSNKQYDNYRYDNSGKYKDYLTIYTECKSLTKDDFNAILEGGDISAEKIETFIKEIEDIYESSDEKTNKTITDIIKEANTTL